MIPVSVAAVSGAIARRITLRAHLLAAAVPDEGAHDPGLEQLPAVGDELTAVAICSGVTPI